MVREIVFDTETTGFDFAKGDRLLEIGAVELVNHLPTGRTYHQYINPDRDVPEDAYKVHGLSYDFLKDFPRFHEVVDDFLEFVGDGMLVAHNAKFDQGFINGELEKSGREAFVTDRFIDTLDIAKALFPGARNNLDALCRRFNIDNSERTSHGALIDSQLLAKVYLELLGGQEPTMELVANKNASTPTMSVNRSFRPAREFPTPDSELKAHEEFLINKLKSPIWNT